jgi:hypothetical protein
MTPNSVNLVRLLVDTLAILLLLNQSYFTTVPCSSHVVVDHFGMFPALEFHE